jgi:uncharacterized protein DUF4136
MRAAATLLLSVALTATGCASSISVAADYDAEMDFSGWRTWAWVPGLTAPNGLNDLSHRRIVGAIEQGMGAHGFANDAAERADVLVSYHVFVRQQSVATTNYDGGGGYRNRYGWRTGPGFSTTWVDTHDVGTLVVDFAESSTGSLGWRGSASAVLDPSGSAEERTARVREAVQALLDQFPPGAPNHGQR